MKSFFWRWQGRLPSPFTRADLRAGYVYELAFRQFEVSDTRVFDHPAAGRAFFEGLVRDHLDLGRPDLVSLVFRRRRAGPLLEDLSYSSRQATYDLRRLKRKGVITRREGTQRYQLTSFGRRIATWFTKAHGRVLTPGLAWTDPRLPATSPAAAPSPSPGGLSTALSRSSSLPR